MGGGDVGTCMLRRRRRIKYFILLVGAGAVGFWDGDGDFQFLRWTIAVDEYSHGHWRCATRECISAMDALWVPLAYRN
jgi:hypothetical protein